MLIKDAVISDCGRYRYQLERCWDDTKGLVCWIMLNPSTADAERDDPTMLRVLDFSQRWGYGRLSVVNLYPFRSPSPRDLARWAINATRLEYDEMKKNLNYIKAEAAAASRIICAWGSSAPTGQPFYVKQDLLSDGYDLWCLARNPDGTPRHPLARGVSRVSPDAEAIRFT